MKTTIEMVREASARAADEYQVLRATAYCDEHLDTNYFEIRDKILVELVRADERNSWPAEMEAMERQVNILNDALAQEREACANVCEEIGEESDSFTRDILRSTAAAIRNRSNA